MVRSGLGLALSLSFLGACGGGGDDDADAAATVDAPATADATAAVAVSLPFAAKVHDAAFACGGIHDVGTPSHPYELRDLRFFLHDVRLIGPAGLEVPVSLDDVEGWQTGGLALVDFEDATGTCAESGTAGTHTTVTGVAASPGPYTGILFTLGVPEEMNHQDPAAATAPLSTTSMLWVWRSGYKFLRLDGASGGSPFHVHLGSTGCPGENPEGPPSGPCTNANRPEIQVMGLDPTVTPVVFDVGALLSGSDVSANTEATAPGCMAAPDDPECPAVFTRLGLAGAAQTTFVAE